MKYNNLEEYLNMIEYYLCLYRFFRLNGKDDKAKKIVLELRDLIFEQQEEDNL